VKNLDKNTKILIVGLGVIGGGYAKALSALGYSVKCITKERRDIDYALNLGIITEGDTAVNKAFLDWADIIVFALYPKTFIDWIREYGHLLRPHALITDVSGVKSGVVNTVQELLPEGVEFISAHPMAGREKSGVEYSDAEVFRGANYIVVPTDKNTDSAIERCKELGYTLGFGRITCLTVKEHDEMIAFLSQLTHCIAVTLMTANDSPELEKYTGDSFRDLTRIAKINDLMWSELFLLNRDALLAEMDSFMYKLSKFRKMIADGDTEAIRAEMRAATAKRELFDKPQK
jgi:prephenate dehydrogenase